MADQEAEPQPEAVPDVKEDAPEETTTDQVPAEASTDPTAVTEVGL